MLFLLPPSETKKLGGTMPSISQVSQVFGALTETRANLVDSLVKLSQKPAEAAKVLKLSKKQLWEIDQLRDLWNAPTMAALERYDGTLYDAISFETLSREAIANARDLVLIQSALFGLISADDRIPFYRLSASNSLPSINLKHTWNSAHQSVFARLAESAPIIDLRSKAYAELAVIPDSIEHYWVEVVTGDEQENFKALNHFNKKAKGEFVRAILESEESPQTLTDLQNIAHTLGFEMRFEKTKALLIIPGN